jgi:hypothetical protein
MSDKFASDEMGGGEDNARKCRSDQLNDMLQRIDVSIQFFCTILNTQLYIHNPKNC